ncbi:MAG: trypsin-like peptidase domain-containing protein [Fuerstiella sp.]
MKLIAMLMMAADPNGQPPPDVVLLDFTAGYCQPCQQMVPVLQRMENNKFPIRKIDITERPDLARKYNVDRIPAFILLVEGQEKRRFLGITAESELRQAMQDASHKLSAARRRQNPTAPPSGNEPQLADNDEQETVATADAPRSGFGGFVDRVRRGLGGGKNAANDDLEHPNFRAQSPDNETVPVDTNALPMKSSVRVRMIDGNMHDFGTGTVIHSSQGQSTILTCAHLFKDVGQNAAFFVDVFSNGEVLKYPATVVGGDHDSDIAFLQIRNVSALPVATLAESPSLRKSDAVFSIGCSNGDLPTRLNMTVVDINRYDGPENILCTTDPSQGRSGGGLFNAMGEVIGVCSAADRRAKQGLYTGVGAIRKVITQLNLDTLFRENPAIFNNTQPEPVAPSAPNNPMGETVDNPFDALFAENAAAAEQSSTSSMQSAIAGPMTAALPSPYDASSAITTSARSTNAPTEITVIIDSADPSKGKQVVVIPRPSPWLLELLTGETPARGVGLVTTRGQSLSATSSRRVTQKLSSSRMLPAVR